MGRLSEWEWEGKQNPEEKEEIRAIEKIKGDKRAFFRFANRKKKMKETIGLWTGER